MRFFAIASVFFTAVVVVFASPIVECQNLSSIPAILIDFETTTGPIVSQFSELRTRSRFYRLGDDGAGYHAEAANATTTILNPLIDDYSMAMNSAQNSLNSLAGQPMNVVMASVNGTTILTASDIENTLDINKVHLW